MVTMTDVAKYAGVSKMTVSRVLNNNGYVKEETREAVLEAVNSGRISMEILDAAVLRVLKWKQSLGLLY